MALLEIRRPTPQGGGFYQYTMSEEQVTTCNWCFHELFVPTTLIVIINDHLNRLHLNKRSTDSRQWSSPLLTASSQGLHRWKPWLAPLLSNFPLLQLSTLLTNPPSRAAVTTTCGVLDPPLGKTRLALARFSLQNIPLFSEIIVAG